MDMDRFEADAVYAVTVAPGWSRIKSEMKAIKELALRGMSNGDMRKFDKASGALHAVSSIENFIEHALSCRERYANSPAIPGRMYKEEKEQTNGNGSGRKRRGVRR